MSILLPADPAASSATPRLLDWGVTLTPPMGGPVQRLNRIGSRFAVDFSMPPLDAPNDRIFVSRLIRGLSEGVVMAFPQALDTGAPGAPIVNGSAQQGSTLQMRGFVAGYRFMEGQFLSIIFGGRRYLHNAAADVIATSSGAMALPIAPMLRISPNDGATVEVAQPMVEGVLSGNSQQWTYRTDRFTEIDFTVTEAA